LPHGLLFVIANSTSILHVCLNVRDEENLQMVSKAFGFEDEPEYSDCEHDSESDSDDLTYFCHNF
jgi:hypothetical protein